MIKTLLECVPEAKDLENEQITDGDITQDKIDAHNACRADTKRNLEDVEVDKKMLLKIIEATKWDNAMEEFQQATKPINRSEKLVEAISLSMDKILVRKK